MEDIADDMTGGVIKETREEEHKHIRHSLSHLTYLQPMHVRFNAPARTTGADCALFIAQQHSGPRLTGGWLTGWLSDIQSASSASSCTAQL